METITLTKNHKCFLKFICLNLLMIFSLSAQEVIFVNNDSSKLVLTQQKRLNTEVVVNSPTSGSTVSNRFRVKGKVPSSYKHVSVSIDGVWQGKSTKENFNIATKSVSNGEHTLKVYAKKRDNSWDDGVTFTITVGTVTTVEDSVSNDSDTDSTNVEVGDTVDDNFVGTVPSEIRVGDPGVKFDPSKFDRRYPEMRDWQKAGVQGGIPFLSLSRITQTISATNTAGLQAAIDKISAAGGGQLLLENGTYLINKTLKMKNNVRMVGKSQSGVVLKITMKGRRGSAIEFGTYGVRNSGIDRLTILGGYGKPNNFTMADKKKNFLIHSVYISGSAKNCWLDKVRIINSGNSAITTWNCKYITIRDCYVERSWNKGAGGHGYVQLSGSYILFYNNTVKKMRHFVIQRRGAHHNVVYKNYFEQDVNFHDDDAGYNLVEQNVSRLPSGLKKQYHSMMGPWSVQHKPPGKKNAVYRNDCKEWNNGGRRSFSNPNKVYVPVRHENNRPFVSNNKTPKGKTFYPVSNVKKEGVFPGEGVADSIDKDELLSLNDVKVYPIPTKGVLNVDFSVNHTIKEIRLVDVTGRNVLSKMINPEDNNLNLNLNDYSLSKGIYILKIIKNNSFELLKLIKS